MFVLGLIVALILIAGGLVLGAWIEAKAAWPFKIK
jgi:hypothetical protein